MRPPSNFKCFEWPYFHWLTWRWSVTILRGRYGHGISWDIRPRWRSEYTIGFKFFMVEISFKQEELMADKAWKAYERRIAAMFGMKRALQKGTEAKEDVAPEEGIDHVPWVIDAKKQKRLAVWSWMRELAEYAEKKGKPPILVFQPWGRPQNYAVVTFDWFLANFKSHVSCFYQVYFDKSERSTFEAAWTQVKDIAKRTNNLPMLRMTDGTAEYVCVQLENLISLMKAKQMLKGHDEQNRDE